MNKEQIIEALDSWNFWHTDIAAGVTREEYLSRLEGLIKTRQVVAITGVRRSGKSTLIKQFMKKRIEAGYDRNSFLYINLEEPKFTDTLSLDFLQQVYDAYLEIIKPKEIPFVLLDEVQNVKGWERFVRSLHEKQSAHIIVSGSNSNLLSKEIGTLLTGRWVNLTVYPLDFQDFLKFRGIKITERSALLSKKVEIKQLLREYLEFGGFPLVALKQEKTELLQRYFEDILGRDVSERHKIRKTEKLKFLAKYFLTNFSSPITYRKVSKFAGISLDTVERFSGYMKDAGIICFIPKFSYSLKEQEVNPKIVYGIDCGLINSVNFRFSDNIGRLYENAVFLHLLRQSNEIYYYKNKIECDFILKKGQKIEQALQVSYQIRENKEREIGGLLKAMKEFSLKEGTIITEDFEGEEKVEGKTIRYIPLWKWLLDEKKI